MTWFKRKPPEQTTWTRVQWTPRPDITTYELAQCMPVFTPFHDDYYRMIERVESLPPEVSRHFTITRTQGLVQI